ncbi:hypothetical protein ACFQFH_02340 [Halobaculum halobium]|uniref:Halobacterial output domain-containing protein n=1 Tax=Halobaculum halobium TaxID=3032281 RepID=A0ABD5TB82_9EURY|nr:hypothetical protein [Halobaculum sp. SYNS20]
MVSPNREHAPIAARERSPLSDDDKRDIARTVGRAVAHDADGSETSEWPVSPGCHVEFSVHVDRIEIRLRYDAGQLPGPVVVPGADDCAPPLVESGESPTAFVALSAAHDALYEDLTDAAGHAVDPYAVAVPDTPVAQSATDGTVTFATTLSVFTGEGSADKRTHQWERNGEP